MKAGAADEVMLAIKANC